jgi:large subunit ribosomal protein L46
LERLPLVHEELPEWERAYEKMHEEVFNKTAKVYPKGFLSDAAQRASNEPDVRNWQPLPRITAADKSDDRKSLMRKLDRRLYLIVKTPKNVWQFPQVEHKAGETMMQV